ncbi:PRC-barrel domain-containing protein [Bradyrhizobium sp. 170]|uniref:PRC-barrel domain-containing protein n=1 Tax=Bradyrhizobium sp. 170 TaxID=2782641 RepID=UPI0020004275|nr:PRC-barrel domain-containing protein [Bradyrhizobium sp. 170]
MPTVKLRASIISRRVRQAQTDLVGKAVILSDGKAGTVESVWLDEMHGLRIFIRGHDVKWPTCTIKFMQPD